MSRNQTLATKIKKERNYTCEKCGYTPSTDKANRIEAHHVVPITFDGEDTKENIVILCKLCHKFVPTEVLPESIVNKESSGSMSVADNPAIREYFEEVTAEFISTNTPPMLDLYVFGMMATNKQVYAEVEDFSFIFRIGSSLSEMDLSIRSREMMWLAAAEMAGYIDISHTNSEYLSDQNVSTQSSSDILSGEDGQLHFTQFDEN